MWKEILMYNQAKISMNLRMSFNIEYIAIKLECVFSVKRQFS